ncbi:MAG: glycosyltransferase family 2 protein [Thermodesulfovibrionales bacterium]|nr:glycosyltransferase family 2 protein [Thermodesulfovibrionales bacterium]
MSQPKISIITICLNSEKFLEETILSVLNQSYKNIEYIIIDGGSTDGTLDIIKRYEDRIDYWVSEPDKGISDAFNKGLKLATGDIIAILNSDDYYAHSDVVQRIVDLFNAPPRKEIVYGRVRCIDQKTGQTLGIYGEPFSTKKMSKEIIVPHPAIFATRKTYETMGPFSLDYKVAMDYEYFLRATSSFEPYFMDEVLSVMRWGGFSVRNIYMAHFEHYRIHRSNGWNLMKAITYQLYGIIMTTLSLALQKAGLSRVVLFYRKMKGRMN